jgi:hypothetical protein
MYNPNRKLELLAEQKIIVKESIYRGCSDPRYFVQLYINGKELSEAFCIHFYELKKIFEWKKLNPEFSSFITEKTRLNI